MESLTSVKPGNEKKVLNETHGRLNWDEDEHPGCQDPRRRCRVVFSCQLMKTLDCSSHLDWAEGAQTLFIRALN